MARPKVKRHEHTPTHLSLAPDRPAFIPPPPFKAATERQREYRSSMRANPLTFGTGPAGTGKTFVTLAYAAELLQSNQIQRLVLVRPLVETGEHLGALPGSLEEKVGPFLMPMLDILYERMGVSFVKYLIGIDRIRVSPLAYMRGSTFKDAFVILTEAQNTSPKQMEMFTTRIGEDAHVVIEGDVRQSDVKGTNGLTDAIERLTHLGQVGHVEFSTSDVVRSGLCQEIVECYEK